MAKAPALSVDLSVFLGKETESNWELREANLKLLSQLFSDPEQSAAELVKTILPRYQDVLNTVPL